MSAAKDDNSTRNVALGRARRINDGLYRLGIRGGAAAVDATGIVVRLDQADADRLARYLEGWPAP